MNKTTDTHALQAGYRLQSKERTYTILRVLGAGSFGITYLASAPVKTGNIMGTMLFAVKEHFLSSSCFREADGVKVNAVPTAKTEVSNSRADFLNEANRLKELCRKSRSIVSVNEAFEANGTAYYVMEYLDGGNPSKCREEEAVALVLQIAEALELIHDDRLLHLDVKPDNIVMKTNEKNETYPVLIDFGIAKHFDSKGRPTSSLSAKGASPGYAPQEQYAGVSEFSPKYDVYALGAVLFYLVTGKNPPDAFKVSLNQQELKRELEGKVSPTVARAILNAMKPNAEERTASIREFRAILSGQNYGSNSPGSHASRTKTAVIGKKDKGRGGFDIFSGAKMRQYWLPIFLICLCVAGLLAILYIPIREIIGVYSDVTNENISTEDTLAVIEAEPIPEVVDNSSWLKMSDFLMPMPEYEQYVTKDDIPQTLLSHNFEKGEREFNGYALTEGDVPAKRYKTVFTRNLNGKVTTVNYYEEEDEDGAYSWVDIVFADEDEKNNFVDELKNAKYLKELSSEAGTTTYGDGAPELRIKVSGNIIFIGYDEPTY